MTIKETARKEYPSINPYDYPETYNYNKSAEKGFIKGAEWMLEKVVERYSLEIDEFNNLLRLIDKKATGLIDKEKSIEKFKKAMEE